MPPPPQVNGQAGPLQFRLYDLGVLGDPPGIQLPSSRALGINNKGEVVGQTSTISYDGTPFVWLYNAAYGQPSRTLISLMPAGSFSFTNSAAHDINEAGIIVGSGPRPFGIDQAQAWRMEPNGQITAVALGNLFLDDPASFEAKVLAVNDQDPPIAVGTSVLTSGEPRDRGAFQVVLTFGGPPPPPLQLLSHAPNVCDDGLGINNPGPGGSPPARTVGARGDCTSASGGDCVESLGNNGITWIGTGLPPFPLLINLTEAPNNRHVARDINDAGRIVGSGRLDFPGDAACIERSAFWNTATAVPFNLGTVAGLDPLEQTLANGINNPDPVTGQMYVVGRNITAESAVLWIGSGTSWTYYDLNDLIVNTCGWNRLREAFAVNNQGYIVGVGDSSPTSGEQLHAFLLVPVLESCLGDLNGDCYVQGFDLALMLGQWGACPSQCCDADLNSDGVVDGLDLAILLGNWNTAVPCDSACKAVAPPAGGGEGAAAPALPSSQPTETVPVGPSAEELIQALIELGYPTLAELLAQILGIDIE